MGAPVLINGTRYKANRANAQASTGPKTADGRARAARNALRHALSLPVCSNPALSKEVETLAREIAGPGAKAQIQELARQVAEAEIDLRRVRCARHQLLSRTLADPHYESRANTQEKATLLRLILQKKAPDLPEATVLQIVSSTPQGPYKFATILSQETKQLLAMELWTGVNALKAQPILRAAW